jgi:SnoaL-like domain
MTTRWPPIADSYVRSINEQDSLAFMALFADAAVVDDVGRTFHGLASIKDWSDREIFDVRVTLQVMDVVDLDGEVVITTEVGGDFDRTGLPDPVVIDHYIQANGGKIVGLTCRLAGAASGRS